MNHKQIDSRMQDFSDALRSAGVKVTHQRMEIFREILQSGQHPDAEAVFNGVRERVPSVSLDTVYRTLWLFNSLGLIATLGQPQERIRFDANPAPHHHFVCLNCGDAQDFHSDEFDALKVPPEAARLGRVQRTYVELRGLCERCARGDGAAQPRAGRNGTLAAG